MIWFHSLGDNFLSQELSGLLLILRTVSSVKRFFRNALGTLSSHNMAVATTLWCKAADLNYTLLVDGILLFRCYSVATVYLEIYDDDSKTFVAKNGGIRFSRLEKSYYVCLIFFELIVLAHFVSSDIPSDEVSDRLQKYDKRCYATIIPRCHIMYICLRRFKTSLYSTKCIYLKLKL